MPASKNNIIRELSGFEKIFWLLDSACHMKIVTFAELKGELDEGQLRQGLDSISKRHPFLKAKVRRLGWSRAEFVRDDLQKPLLIIIRDDGENLQYYLEKELIADMVYKEVHMLRCLWLKEGDGRHRLILTIPHFIGDGMGAAFLMRDFLTATTTKRTNISILNPLPSQENLHPNYVKGCKGFIRSIKLLWHYASRFWLAEKMAALSPLVKSSPDERNLLVLINKFTANETRKLAERAKQEKTTVTGILFAAYNQALLMAYDLWPGTTVIDFSAVDMRRRLQPPLGDGLGIFASAVVFPTAAPMDGDIWSAARRVNHDMAQVMDIGAHFLFFRHFALMGRPIGFFLGAHERAVRLPITQMSRSKFKPAVISNLGALDFPKKFGKLTLESLGFTSSTLASDMPVLTAASVDGGMSVVYTYPQPDYSWEFANKVFKRLCAILRESIK